MSYPATYADADAMLTGRCKAGRKVGNNTYLERRGDGNIAIRLHGTDVATFTPDNNLILNAGGWLTVTTKDRINAVTYGRGVAVSSTRGRWGVCRFGAWDDRVPFADGLTLDPAGNVIAGAPDPADVAAADARAAKLKADISAFVRSITPADIVAAFEDMAGDCWLCRFGRTDCLSTHIGERYFHGTLALRAWQSAGYPSPQAIASIVYGEAKAGRVDSLLTRSLRKYLTKYGAGD